MAENAQRVILGPIVQDGTVLGGAQLYHYAAGLNTVKDIYDDRAKEIALPQPIRADANGMFTFFGDGLYKFILVDAESQSPNEGVISTWDNFSIVDGTDTAIEKGEVVNASSTTPIGPGYWMHILGSVQIAAFSGTLPFFWGVFDGSPTLTNSSNLILPGNRNRAMKTGDIGFFLNEGSGVWRMAAHMESEGGYQGRMGSSYPAAATLAVPQDGDFIEIGGTNADIAGIATMPAGYHFTARFTGSGNQLLHSASLYCPNANDYRLITNEVVTFRSLGAGIWIVTARTGPTAMPGQVINGMFTAADDGFYLPIGTAINCTRHQALAKRLIPATPQLGTTGTALGAATFTNGTDTWSRTTHGLVNGDLVHLTNSGGGLPSGFTASTPYYVIDATTDTFRLSLTRGGAVVDGTTNGTGTQTVHTKVQLPDERGRTKITLDNLGGVAASVITVDAYLGAQALLLGGKLGEEAHQLSFPETPQDVTKAATLGPGTANVSNSLGGDGQSHNNVQPSIAYGAQIRW